MIRASRFMPSKAHPPLSLTAWMLLIGFASWCLYMLWQYPLISGLFFGAVAALHWHHQRGIRHHLRMLATSRAGESICAFARAIDCRTLDTWIVRAVYEEIQDHLSPAFPTFPVRWTDRLVEDLRIDPDAMDEELAMDISERTGRDLRNSDANPLFGKVKTVRDLVLFFHAQPKIHATGGTPGS